MIEGDVKVDQNGIDANELIEIGLVVHMGIIFTNASHQPETSICSNMDDPLPETF